MLSMMSLRMLSVVDLSVFRCHQDPRFGREWEMPTGGLSGRLEGPCAGLVGKGCLSSNRNVVGTVHLHLRALLHCSVSQADALARLEHEHRGEPKKSPGVRGDGLLALLDSAL
jgi:hypothetical protein